MNKTKLAIFLFFAFIVVAFIGLTLEEIFLILWSFVIFGAAIFLFISAKKDDTLQEEKKKKEEETKKGLENFIVEVDENGFYPFDDDYKYEKARLIAGKYKLYGDLNDLYEQAKVVLEDVTKQKEEDKKKDLIKKVEELNREINKSNKYLYYYGREKSIEMLKDQIESYEQSIKAGTMLGDIYVKSATKKERSWAAVGGFAEGLAGPAAGIMAASEVMQENAKIREYNKAVALKGREITNSLASGVMNAKENLIYAKEKLEEAKTKYVADYTTKQAFDMLKININTTKVNQGSIMLSTKVSCKEEIEVSNGVIGQVDGSFAVEVYNKNNYVSKAYFTLPLFGVGTKESTIRSLCANIDISENEKYEYKIIPNNLWVIEK